MSVPSLDLRSFLEDSDMRVGVTGVPGLAPFSRNQVESTVRSRDPVEARLHNGRLVERGCHLRFKPRRILVGFLDLDWPSVRDILPYTEVS